MNYLELVNKVAVEAGVELDPLTQANFTSPQGSKMYSRIKTWVADSWQELQTKGKESFFTNAVVATSLRPRIRVFNLMKYTTLTGKQYYNPEGSVIEVVATGPAISGDDSIGTYSGFLDIDPLEASYGELLLGSYWTEDTLDVNPNTFYISSFPGYAINELDANALSVTSKPIILSVDGSEFTAEFIPWKNWMHPLKGEYGTPRLYTMSPDGYLYFYPALSTNATVLLYINTRPQYLAAYSDVPTKLPEAYHMALVYMAVMKYANYERDTKMWSTANKEYAEYSTTINRDAGMIPRFQDSQYG